ncbi:MAG: hypothetical protein IKX41_02010 [Oscillospiraceae bacterium]|nr:hypothetical protein [Oscillospiraceae bacterium]
MKKTLAIILCVAMVLSLVFALGACGKKQDGGDTTSTSSSSGKDVKGETVDTTVFKAVCPKGWLNIPQTDVWGEQDEDGNYPLKTDALQFCKGAKSEWDAFSKPSVNIYQLTSSIDDTIDGFGWWYKTVEETTFTVNGQELRGVALTDDNLSGDGEYKYECAFINVGGVDFQIMLMTQDDDGSETGLSMADPEVQAIIGSIELD